MSDFHETTAILVDGAFYRKRAYYLFGNKTPEARAEELFEYCRRHLKTSNKGERNYLYRIFYYDCPPLENCLYHPLLKQVVDMSQTSTFSWSTQFYKELKNKRKVALRMGVIQERESNYQLKNKILKKLFRGELTLSDLKQDDFEPNFVQKGVDMRIGLDIASLAYKKQVTQIVLISGDSDFVPAAKLARREGIDFILDPMWQKIRSDLNEHIDGLTCRTCEKPDANNEPLHVDYKQTHHEGVECTENHY